MAVGHASSSPRNYIKLLRDTVLFYAIKEEELAILPTPILTVNLEKMRERGRERGEGIKSLGSILLRSYDLTQK